MKIIVRGTYIWDGTRFNRSRETARLFASTEEAVAEIKTMSAEARTIPDNYGGGRKTYTIGDMVIQDVAEYDAEHGEIKCPDCRARQDYQDAMEAYERGDRDEEPKPPTVPAMICISHDEFKCGRCGNEVCIPDL
jgi:DNA-directed RNA polymerase subunit RPC12/RpoP